MNPLKSEELMLKLAEIKPYLLNIKSVFGIIVILFALYSGFDSISQKWGKYVETAKANTQLLQNKNNLSTEEAKLKAISKELDKLATKIVPVEPGQAPELVTISIAQKIVSLSEKTQNAYNKLDPGQRVVLNVDEAVQLPVNVAGNDAAASAPAPPPPGAKGAVDPKSALNGLKYNLVITGSFIHLAGFIHDLVGMADFILINRIRMTPVPQNATMGGLPAGSSDKITLEIAFTIPWHQ